MKNRIAATIITNKMGEDLNRCYESISPYVDHIFINYNGKDTSEMMAWWPSDPIPHSLRHFDWEDDFAKARNQVFGMVYERIESGTDNFDWILWIDTDDVLINGENLQGMLESLDPATQGVFLTYEYGYNQEIQEVIVKQQRERLFRTDGKWRWVYPIHENCIGPPGTQFAKRTGDKDVRIRHLRDEHRNDADTRRRNRRILARAVKETGEPRYKYYLANELFATLDDTPLDKEGFDKRLRQCIQLYNDFINSSPSKDDGYIACARVAECYVRLEQVDEAINSALQCIKIKPSWPEAYVIIAQCAMSMSDWELCFEWADLCIKNSEHPDTIQAHEPFNKEYSAYILRGIAQEEQRKYDGALADYQRAYEYRATDEIKNRINAIKKHKTSRKKYDRRKTHINTHPDSSVAIFVPPSYGSWHPKKNKEEGAGGAETCVMEIAQRFTKDYDRVVVFGTPGEHRGVYNNVEWWDAYDFTPTEKFNVFISSRSPEIFDSNIRADHKFLWMHDVNVHNHMESPEWGNRLDKVDAVVGLTKWHTNHLRRLYGIPNDKLGTVNNGIDLSRFNKLDLTNKQQYKFVYSSSPDRGLDVLLSIWPQIKERWETAELHIYYGWEIIDDILRTTHDHALTLFKESVDDAFEQMNKKHGGLFWHGRIPQKKLAKELATAHAWLYPTYFLETFCITALEMQAAKVLPFTSNIGGLKESVFCPELRIDGYPNNRDYRKRFIELMDQYLDVDNSERLMLAQAYAKTFTWDDSYRQWLKVIEGKRFDGYTDKQSASPKLLSTV